MKTATENPSPKRCPCGAPPHDGIITRLQQQLKAACAATAVADELVDLLRRDLVEARSNLLGRIRERDAYRERLENHDTRGHNYTNLEVVDILSERDEAYRRLRTVECVVNEAEKEACSRECPSHRGVRWLVGRLREAIK